MKTSKLVWFIQQLYVIVLTSIMFWINIFRGLVVFGVGYSLEKSFEYLQGSYYDKYRERTKGIKIKFGISNLILIFALGVLLYAGRLPLTNVTTFILVVSFAYFILIFTYLIFKSYYKLIRFTDVAQKMLLEKGKVLYALMISILAFFLSGVNLIWLIILIPGILCKMIKISFKRLEKGSIKNDAINN